MDEGRQVHLRAGCFLARDGRPPHLCTSAAQTCLSQERALGTAPHAACWSCPLTVQGVELVRRLAEAWGAGPGVRAAGGGGAWRAGLKRWGGHSPYLGKNRMWSSVRLALWTRCSNTLRKESLTGRERTACRTHGLLGTHGAGACRALWGLGCVPGAAI